MAGEGRGNDDDDDGVLTPGPGPGQSIHLSCSPDRAHVECGWVRWTLWTVWSSAGDEPSLVGAFSVIVLYNFADLSFTALVWRGAAGPLIPGQGSYSLSEL